MLTTFQTLAPQNTLSYAVELILAGSQQDFPVVDSGKVVGVLTRGDLIKALNVFQYVTFRTAYATITALLLSLVFGGRLFGEVLHLDRLDRYAAIEVRVPAFVDDPHRAFSENAYEFIAAKLLETHVQQASGYRGGADSSLRLNNTRHGFGEGVSRRIRRLSLRYAAKYLSAPSRAWQRPLADQAFTENTTSGGLSASRSQPRVICPCPTR